MAGCVTRWIVRATVGALRLGLKSMLTEALMYERNWSCVKFTEGKGWQVGIEIEWVNEVCICDCKFKAQVERYRSPFGKTILHACLLAYWRTLFVDIHVYN